MNESFKINVYFDEQGEELEKIISYLLINQIEKNKNIKAQHLNLQKTSYNYR